MNQGVYTLWGEVATVTTAQTLAYITAPATCSIEIIEAHVTVRTDETLENVYIGMRRVSSLGTPTSTGDMGVFKHNPLTSDFPGTAKYDVTASEPTYTDTATADGQGVINNSGWHHVPPPEARIIIPPSGTLGIRSFDTIADSNLVVSVVVRVLG